VQHKECPVHSFFVEFEWPAFELDGEYLYSSTSSKRALAHLFSGEIPCGVREK
jgi:hypothetical protein